MNSAIRTYSGGGVQPVYGTEGVGTHAVTLPAAKALTKGTVLGQILGSGTAVDEVQTVTVTGIPTGGSIRLVYDGEVTAAIAYNATAAAVQSALEALPSIGTGGVVCGGGPLPGTAVTVTFSAALGGKHHPLLLAINSLTGGTTPAVTPSLTTLGAPANGYWDAYDAAATGAQAGLAKAKAVLEFDCRTDSQARIYFGTEKGASDNGAFDRSAPAYFAGTFRASDLTGLDAAAVADLGRLIAGSTTTLTDSKTLLRMG